jgi:PAS domain S-box-containing protein
MRITNSLSYQLSLILTLIVIIVSSVFVAFSFLSYREQSARELEKQADGYFDTLTQSLIFPLWHIDEHTVNNIGTAFAMNELVALLVIKDENGQELVVIDKKDESTYIERSGDILFKNHQVGTVTIRLSLSVSEAINSRMLKSHLYVIVIIALFLLLATSNILRAFLKKPIRQLDTLAEAYTAGRYGFELNEKTYSEFLRSTSTMQRMGQTIKEQVQTIVESESRFKNFFDNALEGLFQVSYDLTEIKMNPALVSMLGYESSLQFLDILKTSGLELIMELGDFGVVLDCLKKKEPVIELEKEIKRADGQSIWAIISVRPVWVNKNKILYYEGSLIDITKRKIAEMENSSLKRYLDSVVDSMPSSLIGINQKSEVIIWNRQAEVFLGISQEKAMGKPLLDLLPKLSSELSEYARIIEEGTPQSFEKIRVADNGETGYLDILIYPLKLKNRKGAVIRLDDITQKVKMDQMMIHTDKIISVGGMAAGMAHEINNPLGAIMLAIQNISRRFSPDKEKNREVASLCNLELENLNNYLEQRNVFKLLDGMKKSIFRASDIISNMLHYSRRSDSKLAPNDLNRLCDHAIQLAENDYDLKKKFDFRNITITREYGEEMPQVCCTGTEIEQVVLNLLRNSAQAMTEDSAENKNLIRIKTSVEGGMARIEVEDSGPGIDEVTRKRIFEPFFTTKPPGIGTGLGLSVSYMIVVTNHNGTFEVESMPDQGTRFIIQFPVDSPC